MIWASLLKRFRRRRSKVPRSSDALEIGSRCGWVDPLIADHRRQVRQAGNAGREGGFENNLSLPPSPEPIGLRQIQLLNQAHGVRVQSHFTGQQVRPREGLLEPSAFHLQPTRACFESPKGQLHSVRPTVFDEPGLYDLHQPGQSRFVGIEHLDVRVIAFFS
jgi:hypothetical protein